MTDEATEQPYCYLISYTGTVQGRTVNGHVPLHRSHPFTSDALGLVLDFIRDYGGLDGRPIILSVFTLADSADAPKETAR